MKKSIFILLFLFSVIQAQDCLVPADPGGRDVPFPPATATSSSFPSKTQVIMESYTLDCQGDITTWWTYIAISDSTSLQSQSYSFTFQVWRKAQGYQKSGCYTLVGANMFDNISVSEQGLVKAVPLEKDYINAMPGDVIGLYAHFYANSTVTSETNSPRVRLDESYSNETIWYHTNVASNPLTFGSNPCYFSAGKDSGRTLQSLTNAAPLLSLNMEPQTPFPSPPSTVAAVPTSIQVLSSTSSPPTPFLIPTTGGITIDSPRIKWWMWVAIGAGSSLMLLLLLILLIVICLCARRRKKKKKRSQRDSSTEHGGIITPDVRSIDDQSEPIYAEIDADKRAVYASINSLDIEVVGIEVVANESYSMLPANNVAMNYGAVENESDFNYQEVDRT